MYIYDKGNGECVVLDEHWTVEGYSPFYNKQTDQYYLKDVLTGTIVRKSHSKTYRELRRKASRIQQ